MKREAGGRITIENMIKRRDGSWRAGSTDGGVRTKGEYVAEISRVSKNG
jgi:hypothetical protein